MTFEKRRHLLMSLLSNMALPEPAVSEIPQTTSIPSPLGLRRRNGSLRIWDRPPPIFLCSYYVLIRLSSTNAGRSSPHASLHGHNRLPADPSGAKHAGHEDTVRLTDLPLGQPQCAVGRHEVPLWPMSVALDRLDRGRLPPATERGDIKARPATGVGRRLSTARHPWRLLFSIELQEQRGGCS